MKMLLIENPNPQQGLAIAAARDNFASDSFNSARCTDRNYSSLCVPLRTDTLTLTHSLGIQGNPGNSSTKWRNAFIFTIIFLLEE